MKFARFGKVRFALTVCFGLGGFVQPILKAQPAVSVEEIVRQTVAHSQQAGNRATRPAYTYTKVTLTTELDSEGHIKESKERSYQVTFRDGATCVKLVAVNGRAPGEAELKQLAEKEMNLQQLFGPSKSAKSAKTESRETTLTPELAARFSFTLAATETINGRRTYRVAFESKSPAPPVHHVIDRVLNRLSGTLWIDAQEFEIARADIRLGSEVNLLGGVVGSLKKLAFTINRTRVADGVWFSTSSNGDFEGRKLLDPKRIRTKSRSTNFQPLA
jgi:hypothetical protein